MMLHPKCNNENFGEAVRCILVETDCDSDEAGSDAENKNEDVQYESVCKQSFR
jgi:hypothetical protein